jgi:hypothetical protein
MWVSQFVKAAAEDAYVRLIAPSAERELRNTLTERAGESAIANFALNLKPLLMQPPVKGFVTMGLDPGYRNGCKVAVVDATGRVLDTNVVYPTFSQRKQDEAIEILSRMIRKHLETAESDILWSEALTGLDHIEGSVHSADWSGIKIVPFEKFYFLLPHLQLIAESNRLSLIYLYRNAKKFHDVPLASAEMSYTVFNHLAHSLVPSFQSAGDRFLQRDLEQQAIEFFIDQELYRLEHGKLPDKLPLPVDPFSKKPMEYLHGKVTVKKEVYEKENKEFTISARQLKSPSRGALRNVTVTIPDSLPGR